MIRTVNDILAAGINELIPPSALDTRELTVLSSGVGLTFAASLSFLDIKNDSKKDSVWVRLGSLLGTTDSSLAVRLGPQDALELFSTQLPNGTDRIALATMPGLNAPVRILAGVD